VAKGREKRCSVGKQEKRTFLKPRNSGGVVPFTPGHQVFPRGELNLPGELAGRVRSVVSPAFCLFAPGAPGTAFPPAAFASGPRRPRAARCFPVHGGFPRGSARRRSPHFPLPPNAAPPAFAARVTGTAHARHSMTGRRWRVRTALGAGRTQASSFRTGRLENRPLGGCETATASPLNRGESPGV